MPKDLVAETLSDRPKGCACSGRLPHAPHCPLSTAPPTATPAPCPSIRWSRDSHALILSIYLLNGWVPIFRVLRCGDAMPHDTSLPLGGWKGVWLLHNINADRYWDGFKTSKDAKHRVQEMVLDSGLSEPWPTSKRRLAPRPLPPGSKKLEGR